MYCTMYINYPYIHTNTDTLYYTVFNSIQFGLVQVACKNAMMHQRKDE